jgi:xanthine dehydrogenase accessory factor
MVARNLRILIRGAGELASATAYQLHRAGFGRILMLERRYPKAVRRRVCFSEAVFDGVKHLDGVTARHARDLDQAEFIHRLGDIAIAVLPLDEVLASWKPDVYIEAAMLHSNWGLTRDMAPIVIALGPGYTAGQDCHAVVDTHRGPAVGAVLEDTGEHVVDEPPATILGYSDERVLKAARDGVFFTQHRIGDEVEIGQRIGMVVSVYGAEDYRRGVPVDSAYAVKARISGVIRGLLRDGVPVAKGDKIGDVDPRGHTADLDHISDKARRVAEGVHEALLGLIAEGAARKQMEERAG